MAFALTCPLIATLCLLAASVASAAVWQGEQSAGTLQFDASQAGAKFTGSFKTFSVRLDFDPEKPAGGSLDVTVTLASADTADAERDEIVRSADFLWIERHPQAVFRSSKFTREGARWRADGELTLRGIARPVAVLFTVDQKRQQLAMKGTAALRRLQFGVGQGEWATTEWIGDAVGVRFDLRLDPVAAAAAP